ncbi:MAG: MTAP family purine nucleoside phosphorylase [Candidatus Caldipriscus sp.]|jgi:5'-methylthioadenosine phosphorylase
MRIGVIGGSGFYTIEGFDILDRRHIKRTPWGEPSADYIIAGMNGHQFIFLARHGHQHRIPPHKINYRANIWGFRLLEVDRIFAISAVGTIDPNIEIGSIVIPDQLIDFTRTRGNISFYDGIFTPDGEFEHPALGMDRVYKALSEKKVVHVDVSEPFCPQGRKVAYEVLSRRGLKVIPKGTYISTEGPRLETSAEIKAFRIWGADIVGMTAVPEAFLARELEICYTLITVVTNFAAGISPTKLTTEEVIRVSSSLKQKIIDALPEIASELPEERDPICSEALKDTVM